MKTFNRKKTVVALCGMLMLAACASGKSEEEASLSAEELYKQGYQDLQKTAYAKAAENFEKVEIEHPYSRWAVKAKLMGGYAHYKNEKYDDAVISFERFIKFHPGNKDVAYAYYMKGLCYYDQISPADKDQSITAKANDALQQVVITKKSVSHSRNTSVV